MARARASRPPFARRSFPARPRPRARATARAAALPPATTAGTPFRLRSASHAPRGSASGGRSRATLRPLCQTRRTVARRARSGVWGGAAQRRGVEGGRGVRVGRRWAVAHAEGGPGALACAHGRSQCELQFGATGAQRWTPRRGAHRGVACEGMRETPCAAFRPCSAKLALRRWSAPKPEASDPTAPLNSQHISATSARTGATDAKKRANLGPVPGVSLKRTLWGQGARRARAGGLWRGQSRSYNVGSARNTERRHPGGVPALRACPQIGVRLTCGGVKSVSGG